MFMFYIDQTPSVSPNVHQRYWYTAGLLILFIIVWLILHNTVISRTPLTHQSSNEEKIKNKNANTSEQLDNNLLSSCSNFEAKYYCFFFTL